MTQEQDTAKPSKFQHLTKKRAQIEIITPSRAAKDENCARSLDFSLYTVPRELARGTADQIDSELRLYRRFFWMQGSERMGKKKKQPSADEAHESL